MAALDDNATRAMSLTDDAIVPHTLSDEEGSSHPTDYVLGTSSLIDGNSSSNNLRINLEHTPQPLSFADALAESVEGLEELSNIDIETGDASGWHGQTLHGAMSGSLDLDQNMYTQLPFGSIRLLRIRPVSSSPGCSALSRTWPPSTAHLIQTTGLEDLLHKSRPGLLRHKRHKRAMLTNISCALETHSLENCPQYIALSYAWGMPPAESCISVNGREVLIRKNLWRFLLEVSKNPDRWPYLWIDALCINQADHSERSHQVQVMPSIYRNAATVCIWLGPSYAESDQAMRDVAQLSRERAGSGGRRWQRARVMSAAFLPLCSRKYWTRLWICQEVLLAKTKSVLCGNRSVAWESFQAAALDIPGHRIESQMLRSLIADSPAFRLLRVLHKDAHDIANRSVFDLMEATSHLICAERRDKVFALLGIFTRPALYIVPTYGIHPTFLLNQVLEEHVLRHPAMQLHAIAKVCDTLEQILGQPPDSIFDLVDHTGRQCITSSHLSMTLVIPHVSRKLSLGWAHHYGHVSIAKQLMAHTSLRTGVWETGVLANEDLTALNLPLIYAIDPAGVPVNDWILDIVASLGCADILRSMLQQWTQLHQPVYSATLQQAFRSAVFFGHTHIMDVFRELTPHTGTSFKTWPAITIGVPARERATRESIESSSTSLPLPEHACCCSRNGGVIDAADKKCTGTAAESLPEQACNLIRCAGVLQQAARNGDGELLHHLLDHGYDVDTTYHSSHEQSTALFYAIASGKTNLARLLVSRGANIDRARRYHSKSRHSYHVSHAVFEAACAGHLDCVEYAFGLGLPMSSARIVQKPHQGFHYVGHALFQVAVEGSIEMVASLLERGADPLQHSLAFTLARGRAASDSSFIAGEAASYDINIVYSTAVCRHWTTVQLLLSRSQKSHIWPRHCLYQGMFIENGREAAMRSAGRDGREDICKLLRDMPERPAPSPNRGHIISDCPRRRTPVGKGSFFRIGRK